MRQAGQCLKQLKGKRITAGFYGYSIIQKRWCIKLKKYALRKFYHINNQRIQHDTDCKGFDLHHRNLKDAISAMKETIEQTLNGNVLLPSAKKLLISLNKHWFGLIVFIDHPEIPMDNNTAEPPEHEDTG